MSQIISFLGTFVLLFPLLTMESGEISPLILFPDEIKWIRLDYCLLEDKIPAIMPYPNPKGKFKCYSLLEQGPCKEGEWLVLDKTNKEPTTKCEKNFCGNFENTVPSTSGECRSINDVSECLGDNMELQINPYGIGKFH